VLSAKVVTALAQGSGMSEKGVRRALGSLRVPLVKEGRPTAMELGFNLSPAQISLFATGGPDEIRALAEGLREFRNRCPPVAEWMGRGDFREDQSAAYSYSTITHAARTASRIRARLVRRLPVRSA
jgi:hypothetical protein